MINPKTLTNAYLYELAHTDIDTSTYTEIESFLREKLDGYSKAKTAQVPADKVKAILINKLKNIPGVDMLSILDESGFQFSTLGLKANGVDPVTVLIIDEGK